MIYSTYLFRSRWPNRVLRVVMFLRACVTSRRCICTTYVLHATDERATRLPQPTVYQQQRLASATTDGRAARLQHGQPEAELGDDRRRERLDFSVIEHRNGPGIGNGSRERIRSIVHSADPRYDMEFRTVQLSRFPAVFIGSQARKQQSVFFEKQSDRV